MRLEHLLGPGLLAAAILLSGCGREPAAASGAGTSAETLVREPRSEHPLVVVAIDGASWEVLDPLIAAGELPHFAELVRRGCRGRLLSFQPLRSPVIWTSVATGRYARQHGILDFVVPFAGEGRRRLIDSTYRSVPAVWNLASEAGLRVATVGWFVTHPVEIVNGWMVSDRFLQLGEGVYPEELQDRATRIRAEVRSERERLLSSFLRWNYDPRDAEDPDHPLALPTRVVSKRVDNQIVVDEFTRRMTREALAERFDLLLCYYRIVDHTSHAAWKYHDATDFDPPPDPREVELLGELVRNAYRFVDGCLGEVLSVHGEHANLFVVSDHGFGSATGIYVVQGADQAWLSGNHRLEGVFLAAGPDVRPGVIEAPTLFDLPPTLLSLLGIPLSEELAGRVLEEALNSPVAPARIASYAAVPWFRPGGPDAVEQSDTDEIETLRALGYLGQDPAGGAEDPSADRRGFWDADDSVRIPILIGEICHRSLRADAEGLRDLAREIREHGDEFLLEVLRGAAAVLCFRVEELAGRTPLAPQDDGSSTSSDPVASASAKELLTLWLQSDLGRLRSRTRELAAAGEPLWPAVVRAFRTECWNTFTLWMVLASEAPADAPARGR